MLNNEEKIKHATYMLSNVNKRLYEIELEKQLLERSKLTAKEGQLIQIENMLTALKAEERSYRAKEDLLEDELKELNKK